MDLFGGIPTPTATPVLADGDACACVLRGTKQIAVLAVAEVVQGRPGQTGIEMARAYHELQSVLDLFSPSLLDS